MSHSMHEAYFNQANTNSLRKREILQINNNFVLYGPVF